MGFIVMCELASKNIARLAVTDELTGLYNRRFFNESFSKTLSAARRHKQPLTLISIDLDHFKKVNDTFGHSVGDLRMT
ncbi:MAG: GGDEF domain-containing protein [Desulfuromonadaceae bacterium]